MNTNSTTHSFDISTMLTVDPLQNVVVSSAAEGLGKFATEVNTVLSELRAPFRAYLTVENGKLCLSFPTLTEIQESKAEEERKQAEARKAQMEADRKRWIASHVAAYMEDISYSHQMRLDQGEVIVTHRTGRNTIIGAIAHLRPGDKWDLDTGIAVAYARLNGEKIPEYI